MAQLSDLVLERYALGELPAHRRREVEAAIAADPAAAARLAAIEESNRRDLEALPPAEVAREVQRRHHLEVVAERHNARARQRRWLAAGGVLATAAAVLVLLVVVPRGGDSVDPAPTLVDDRGDRAKGDARLVIHRKRAGQVEQLAAGSRVSPGDLLQLSYVAAGAGHGVILSIDGGGAVTLHYPERAGDSTRLRDGGAVGLPHSYELDDAPAFERFFFLTSKQPVDVDELLARADSLAREPAAARDQRLPIPDGVDHYSLLLRKESSP